MYGLRRRFQRRQIKRFEIKGLEEDCWLIKSLEKFFKDFLLDGKKEAFFSDLNFIALRNRNVAYMIPNLRLIFFIIMYYF